jgi:DNA-binding transcriptional LysR family regulator
MSFHLNSNDAELLVHFESHPSLELLAKKLGKDSTVISKQLKRISEQGDFLTKISGRWCLTQTGKDFNRITREYINSQNLVLEKDLHIRIGSTREFSSRILGSSHKELLRFLGVSSISFHTFEDGTEEALLQGRIDFAMDCGRPYSPEIAFKRTIDEPIAAVASKSFCRKLKTVRTYDDLSEHAHVLCTRLHPDRVRKGHFKELNITTRSNDIATTRSLCLSGIGWALLPIYTVQEELKSGKLQIVQDLVFNGEQFGVWYLRDRKSLKKFYLLLIEWMKSKEGQMSF